MRQNYIYSDEPGSPQEGLLWLILLSALALALGMLMAGCKTVEYVPVVENHTEHHWHTDSVLRVDTVHTESTTTIMQLDSAAMAQYGIRLQKAERAWLVRSQELERRLSELQHMTATRDTIHDSIPQPYPVEVVKEVEKPLTRWQTMRMHMGELLLALLAAVVIWKTKKWLP